VEVAPPRRVTRPRGASSRLTVCSSWPSFRACVSAQASAIVSVAMDTPHDVRARLLAALEADLVGPFTAGVAGIDPAEAAASDETLTLAPSRWYLTGFLAPQGARAPEPDDMDSNGGELAAGSESQADDAGSEEPEPKRPVRFPASMGLSVYLPAASKGTSAKSDVLVAEVSYADYDKVEVATDREDKKQNAWKRVAHGPVSVEVPLDEATLQKGIGVPGSRGLRLQGELRTTEMEGLEHGARVLSLFLVNDRAALEQDRDLNFVFQVRLALRYEHGFLWRPNRKRRGRRARRRSARAGAPLPRSSRVGRGPQHEPPEPRRRGRRQGPHAAHHADPSLRSARRRAPPRDRDRS
jgi:hypothetical protein